MNRSADVWGPDAEQFNPDRFDHTGYPHTRTPGVYAKLMTFGAGNHNCMWVAQGARRISRTTPSLAIPNTLSGHRFALAEVKTTLFVLLRRFAFEPLPSNPQIFPQQMLVSRPYVKGEEIVGPQMPLLVRPLPET